MRQFAGEKEKQSVIENARSWIHIYNINVCVCAWDGIKQ